MITTLHNTSIAVTGGCGFIGSHLIQSLRRLGARVLVIDSLEYGKRENVDATDPGITIQQFELRSGIIANLTDLLRGVDFVFHLAAEKHNQSLHSPTRVLEANVIGTYELLKASAEVGIKKFIFASSLYAYGRMLGPPMCEDETPSPQTVYGVSKLSGEHLCRQVHLQYGLQSVCLRLFFVYGPRQYIGTGYKSVIVKNFEQLLAGLRPIIHGDGAQQLDYIYVGDVVSTMLLALSDDTGFGVFNVGTGRAVTVNDLTKIMMKIAGVETACEFRPPDLTHGSSRVANTKNFENHFGHRPFTPLEHGLQLTYDWMTAAKR